MENFKKKTIKRGAPQKNDANKKKYCISVNCTAAQKEKIEEKAEELGLSVSAYMMPRMVCENNNI